MEQVVQSDESDNGVVMNEIYCPKCEHAYEPTGDHETDEGETECDECGFKFIVEIEYDPTYDIRCVEHEFGLTQHTHKGERAVAFQVCEFCNHIRLVEECDAN